MTNQQHPLTPHRATAEQWQSLENDDTMFAYEACILELRARVEQLEVANAKSPEEDDYEVYIAEHERWLPIRDYENYYMVSSMGRIKSEDRTIKHERTGTRFIAGKILKTGLNPRGYEMIVLSKNGKKETKMIHHIVAEAFIGPRPEGMLVCHGPNGKHDNRVENLYYSTPEQNNGTDKRRDGTALIGERNHRALLTDEDVLIIRASEDTGRNLARFYGVSEQCISDIRNYRRWTHLQALEAGSTCPHIRSSDEGTSYCGLAEQQAAATPPEPAPDGSLVETVHIAISTAMGHGPSEARAAIRAVAEWLREHHADGDPVAATALEREARR